MKHLETDGKTEGVVTIPLGSTPIDQIYLTEITEYLLEPVTKNLSEFNGGQPSVAEAMAVFGHVQRWGLIQEDPKGENPENLIQQLKSFQAEVTSDPHTDKQQSFLALEE